MQILADAIVKQFRSELRQTLPLRVVLFNVPRLAGWRLPLRFRFSEASTILNARRCFDMKAEVDNAEAQAVLFRRAKAVAWRRHRE